MGVFEDPRFEAGTRTVAEAVAEIAEGSPWSVAATAQPPSPSSALPIESTTSPPAAELRSS
jgi:hypothetical protein